MSLLATSTCIAREDKGFNPGQTVSQHCVASKRYFSRGDLGLIPGSGLQSSSKRAVPKPNGSSKQDRMTSVGNNLHRNPINKTATTLLSCTCVTSVPTGSPHWDPQPHGPMCCRLSHCFVSCGGCSHRAPRTNVSMWIASTARCDVCYFHSHLLL